MLIYKIFRGPEWAELVENGQTLGAPIDLADGFVHLSTAEQAPVTASLYFAGVEGLELVAIEADAIPEVKWQASRGGALFPHMFREMRMRDVVWHRPLPLTADGHDFGELV